MVNLEIIKNNMDVIDTICLYYNDVINEIDEETQQVITSGCEFINISDLDEEGLAVYEVEEYGLYDEVAEYIKDLKKVKKSVNNIFTHPKTFWAFRLEEDYIFSEEQMYEFDTISWLTENFHNLSLYKFTKAK